MAAQLAEADRVARELGTARFTVLQNQYSLLERRDDDEVLPLCRELGVAYIPYFPLAAGQSLRTAKLKKVATRLGASTAQVALAWLLARSPAMLPIPGTGRIAHLEENVGAVGLKLSDEDMKTLG